MARTITIDPGKELSGFIEGLVETGSYKTTSEVVRDGLRLLQEKNAESNLQKLRNLIDDGESSGEATAVNADDFLTRMRKMTNG